MHVSRMLLTCSGLLPCADGPGMFRSLRDCVKLSGHGDEQELLESMNLRLLATVLLLMLMPSSLQL